MSSYKDDKLRISADEVEFEAPFHFIDAMDDEGWLALWTVLGHAVRRQVHLKSIPSMVIVEQSK